MYSTPIAYLSDAQRLIIAIFFSDVTPLQVPTGEGLGVAIANQQNENFVRHLFVWVFVGVYIGIVGGVGELCLYWAVAACTHAQCTATRCTAAWIGYGIVGTCYVFAMAPMLTLSL